MVHFSETLFQTSTLSHFNQFPEISFSMGSTGCVILTSPCNNGWFYMGPLSCDDSKLAHSFCQLSLFCILQEYNLLNSRNLHFFCLLLYLTFPITPGKTWLFCVPLGSMSWWVRGLVAKSGDLSCILRTHKVEGEKWLPESCSLVSMWHTHYWPTTKEIVQKSICKFISLKAFCSIKNAFGDIADPGMQFELGNIIACVVLCFSVIVIPWWRESECSSGDFGELCPAAFA